MTKIYNGPIISTIFAQQSHQKFLFSNNCLCIFQSRYKSFINKVTSFPSVLVYKALNNLTPAYISDLLTPISQSHNRTLKSTTSGSLAVPRSKKAMYDGSFSSSAPWLWNTLPESVKKSASLKDFKRCVKEHI